MTAPKPEAPTLDSTDAAVGKRWRENSSLEEWFPYTAQELNGLRERLCAIDNAIVPQVAAEFIQAYLGR